MGEIVDLGSATLPGLELGSELLRVPVEEVRKWKHKGDLVSKDAERVAVILQMDALGMPMREICAQARISLSTLSALRVTHAAKLVTLKERLGARFGVLAQAFSEKAMEVAQAIDVDQLSDKEKISLVDKLTFSAGVASDKMLTLAGEASVIVGRVGGEDGERRETLRERLAGMRRAEAVPEMGLIEVGGFAKQAAGLAAAVGDGGSSAVNAQRSALPAEVLK